MQYFQNRGCGKITQKFKDAWKGLQLKGVAVEKLKLQIFHKLVIRSHGDFFSKSEGVTIAALVQLIWNGPEILFKTLNLQCNL